MPSQIDLSDEQVTELLLYHRIKGRAQYVCSECFDEDEVRERECFVCGATFSRKSGVIGPRKSSKQAGVRDTGGVQVDPMLSYLKRLSDSKKTPEEHNAAKQKWLANARDAGILME